MKYKRQKSIFYSTTSLCVAIGMLGFVHAQDLSIESERLKLSWTLTEEGYQLDTFALKSSEGLKQIAQPIGEYRFRYTDSIGKANANVHDHFDFPDSSYVYITGRWKNGVTPVALDREGEEWRFFPSDAVQQEADRVTFTRSFPMLDITSTWSFGMEDKNDLIIDVIVKASKEGHYAFKSPMIAKVSERELEWGTIPGYVHANTISDDFVRAYAYGHGITSMPVVVRERGAGTLVAMVTDTSGLTLAVSANPGLGRDPWNHNAISNSEWNLGMSLALDSNYVSPILTYPMLGSKNSYLRKGDSLKFKFIISLSESGWFPAFRHVVYDHYRLKEQLDLRKAQKSITDRLFSMNSYVVNDSLSLWRVERYNDRLIGAQEYHGGVLGADKDAMKNSDYGAMWMLASLMQDSVLLEHRLPYARNFKLEQQDVTDPFFKGAVKGQYYLWKSKRFVEEWGDYVEPVALTYYTMLDIGNMLLFEPQDRELEDRLRLGAERLLDWQLPDGSWQVAYDRDSKNPLFLDLKDYRATFYGLLVAYRILKDERYLEAAKRGADWFNENGVKNGYLLGVCGDTRFVPDFATAQSAQAFLDLYDITGLEDYKQAAIELARIYTLSIITHPIPSEQEKLVNGAVRQDWQIAQAGLNFEHGGLLGSSNGEGPILLASHAGLFARITHLTGDSLFVDLARAAVWGRDAFVDSVTSVASYYWRTMDRGPGPYPHHAWWQVGWIVDYLVSEAELRSNGEVRFPGGFVTPKVGPHKPYGFEDGVVFGKRVKLFMPKGTVRIANPNIDWIGAKDAVSGEVYLILLNNSRKTVHTDVELLANHTLKKISIEAEGLHVLNIGLQK